MKDIRPKLIELFKEGHCTPQISELAKAMKEPATTLHYNIKKLEKEAIVAYKAVFDYKKIDEGYCNFILIKLSQKNFAEPEKIAKELAKDSKVESVDIINGEYELIVKLRTKDIEEYYSKTKEWIKSFDIIKINNLTSLKQMKTEFVKLE